MIYTIAHILKTHLYIHAHTHSATSFYLDSYILEVLPKWVNFGIKTIDFK